MQTDNNGNRDRDWRENQNRDRNQNTGNLGNENEQRMGNRGNGMDDWDTTAEESKNASPRNDAWSDTDQIRRNEESRDMRSDNDDFNDSGWDDRNNNEDRSADSRTFNEDESSWEEEQHMGGSNRGTTGNDWNENDQMQRGKGRGFDGEENRDASSSDYYEDDRQDRDDASGSHARNNSGDDF